MRFIAKFLHSLIFATVTRGDYKMKMVLQEKEKCNKILMYVENKRDGGK